MELERKALALAGSAGWIEIAVREGSAAALLGLRRGDPVALTGGTAAVDRRAPRRR